MSVIPEGQDIAKMTAEITATDSPLMRQAKTAGMQTANRRGVMNSSMGIGAAQAAALNVATPIASQQSQQSFQADQTRAQIAASERQALLQAQTQMRDSYNSALSSTLNNHEIPAAARDAVQRSLLNGYQADAANIAALYGVSLPTWPTVTTTPQQNYNGTGIGSGAIM